MPVHASTEAYVIFAESTPSIVILSFLHYITYHGTTPLLASSFAAPRAFAKATLFLPSLSKKRHFPRFSRRSLPRPHFDGWDLKLYFPYITAERFSTPCYSGVAKGHSTSGTLGLEASPITVAPIY